MKRLSVIIDKDTLERLKIKIIGSEFNDVSNFIRYVIDRYLKGKLKI